MFTKKHPCVVPLENDLRVVYSFLSEFPPLTVFEGIFIDRKSTKLTHIHTARFNIERCEIE